MEGRIKREIVGRIDRGKDIRRDRRWDRGSARGLFITRLNPIQLQNMPANPILMIIKPKAKILCFCPFKEKEEFGSVYALFGNASFFCCMRMLSKSQGCRYILENTPLFQRGGGYQPMFSGGKYEKGKIKKENVKTKDKEEFKLKGVK